MLCKEVMKKDVEWISENDSAQVAARKMREANVGFLPVCNGSRRVIGALTDRDLALRLVANNLPATTKARDVMTNDVVSCDPDDDIAKAQELMGSKQKSRILCISKDGRLSGVISLSDIVQRGESKQAFQTMKEVTSREART